MDEIIKLLSNVSAGTVLKWVVIIIGLIGSLSVLLTKCYDTFEKWRKRKNYKEVQEKQVLQSEQQIKQFTKLIEDLSSMIELFRKESIERDKIQIRHTIVTSCNKALAQGNIDNLELQALEDLYSLYTSEPINGNSYATTLMVKVRKLPSHPKE